MTIVSVGSVSVNFSAPGLYLFKPVALQSNQGYFFQLSTTPAAVTLNYGYLLVIPVAVLAGVSYERPLLLKYFPKGMPVVFKVSTPNNYLKGATWALGLYPISTYPGQARPSPLTCNLSYSDQTEQVNLVT